MVVIRLARGGSKKNPFYHLVAADQRFPRDGRFIENLGYFNPMARGQQIRLTLDAARIEHWLKVGAQASERVKTLIKKYSGSSELATSATRAEMRKEQAQNSATLAAEKAKKDAAIAAEAAKAEAIEATKAPEAEAPKADAE